MGFSGGGTILSSPGAMVLFTTSVNRVQVSHSSLQLSSFFYCDDCDIIKNPTC